MTQRLMWIGIVIWLCFKWDAFATFLAFVLGAMFLLILVRTLYKMWLAGDFSLEPRAPITEARDNILPFVKAARKD